MNAQRLSWLILVSGSLVAGPLWAGTTEIGVAVRAFSNSVGQAETATTREQADEMLRRARGAMKENDLKQARWYLERVEQSGVSYGGVLSRLGDTPKKLRRDLAKLDPTLSDSTGDAQLPPALPVGGEAPAPLPQDLNAGRLVNNPYAAQVGATNGQPLDARAGSDVQQLKAQAGQLLQSAEAALRAGDLTRASQLVQQAQAMRVPNEAYAAGEKRPWMVLLQIERAKRNQQPVAIQPQAANGQVTRRVPSGPGYETTPYDSMVRPASAEEPVAGPPADNLLAQTTPGFDGFESNDLQPLPQAAGSTPSPQPLSATDTLPSQTQTDDDFLQLDSDLSAAPPLDPQPGETSPGYDLIKKGEQAIKDRDFTKAREYFAEAWKYERELDDVTRQRLQDNLQYNNVRVSEANDEEVPAPNMSVAEQAAVRRFASRVARDQTVITRQLASHPKRAYQDLKKLRGRVADAEIPAASKERLLARVDRALNDAERYIERNRAKIELDERNREVLAEIEMRRNGQIERGGQVIQVDDELAKMVDEFNKLMDQERFSEAVVQAKKARELAPDSPTVEMMVWKSRFAERLLVEMSIRERSENGVAGALTSVVESGIPFDDRLAIAFPNAKSWEDLTATRLRALREGSRRLSDTELEIQRALRKPVQIDFRDQSLNEVVTQLGNLAGVTIYLDPQGLAAEGATSEMPVTIQLNQEVQLKSALNIILSQFGLTYMIQDEVLKVTSETIRASETDVQTYNVADLVIPIPNFVASYDMGLPSAIREAYNAQGFGAAYQGGYSQAPLTVMANNQQGAVGGQTLAQLAASQMSPGGGGASPQPLGFGPGGLGGGANADFDTLIDLITATIAPDTWDDVGGDGSIQGFPTNLSLVVNQTQEVHDQIADLLEQLRKLQDLQVTIEVRFITLNDNFFERIGVDFDFDIDDNVVDLPDDDGGPSVTIGLDPQGNPTADLDLSFTQDTFAATQPAFGGFTSGSGANFGFAILSDIEAFFVIEAAQGDTRTNVLQAPKVTLFNGQTANVNDQSQRPFVTSVTPVVGDFAAAQAPIIVVLSEGTSLNVQAVVSNDRRFVRLTLVPFFSRIGDVEEFTFEGSRTTRSGTAVTDPVDDTSTVNNDAEEIISGTTVQLPQFAFTSVSTTVSVPDGGTILLGGIKRLSEDRREQGVPLLSKFPYINRLFKNVGIGRSTQSLMMMVTPRIIIQEEEESKLGISTATN